MKRCPVCNGDLFARTVRGVRAFGCRGCGGCWFDGGDLKQLASEDPAELVRLDDQFRPGLQAPLEPMRSLKCPTCTEPLAASPYRGVAGTQILACASCRGVFFEHGNLRRVGAALSGAPLDATAEQSRSGKGGPLLPVPHGLDVASPLPMPSPRRSRPEPLAVTPAAFPVEGEPSVGLRTPRGESVGLRTPRGESVGLRTPPDDPTSTEHLPVVLHDVFGAHPADGLIARGMGYLRASYGLLWTRKTLLLPPLFNAALSALILLIGYFVLLQKLDGRWEELFSGNVLAVVFGLAAVAGVIGSNHFFFMGMTVSMVDAHVKGLPVSIGTAFRDAFKNLRALALLSLLSPFVGIGFVFRARAERGSGMAMVFIDSTWTVGAYLVLPIIVIQDMAFWKSTDRASRLHRGNLVQLALNEMGINFFQGLANCIVLVPAIFLVMQMAKSGAGWSPTLVVSAIVVGSLVAAAHVAAKMAYYTCRHLRAVDDEREAQASQLRIARPVPSLPRSTL